MNDNTLQGNNLMEGGERALQNIGGRIATNEKRSVGREFVSGIDPVSLSKLPAILLRGKEITPR